MVIITQLLLSTVETLQLSDGGSVSKEFGNRSTLLWPGKGKAGKSCPTRGLPLWIFDGSIFCPEGCASGIGSNFGLNAAICRARSKGARRAPQKR
jgi:hypothetical protein